jgi:ABC-2 type transport system permease protein
MTPTSPASPVQKISTSGVTVEIPPSVDREGAIFWRLRSTIFRAILEEAFYRARLRTSLLIILSLVFWIGLFWLFMEGFTFLRITLTAENMRSQIVHAIFNTFFFTLTFMITLSAAIVLYGGLFRSQETSILLTYPIRPERIVFYKYQETVFISCWGLVLLGTPLLIAYGVVNNAPWLYFVLLVPFMLAFVMIPTSLGALACLLVAYAMPEMRRRALTIAGAITLVLIGWLFWQTYIAASQQTLTPAWVRDMLARLRFTEHYLFPNWWLSTGLLEAAHPLPGTDFWANDAIMFLCVLCSNALLLQLMLWGLARRTFRTSFSRLQGLLPTQQPAKIVLGDRGLLLLLRGFSPLSRALMLKDVRLFRRDPVLWAQFLIFWGLLTFYVISLQRFEETAINFTPWLTVMGFMNVGVIALIYSTFATRFILPIISLEGRAFWVLGTAPIQRERVITSKFLLASVVSIPPCLLLIIASDFMLPIAKKFPLLVFVHAIAITIMCITLSALAVGNGARFPNLRENSPSRIASGFGGTLNLVESGLLIIGFLFAIGLPGYFWVAQNDWNARDHVGFWQLGSSGCVILGLLLASTISLLASWAALSMGQKAFRNLEA